VVLIDCVTVWIGNLMHAGRGVAPEVERLVAAVRASTADIIVVSNEVGLSIVPENALARRFRDAQGLANQALAAAADKVVLVAAGLPLTLKG
jgi:adenosylcobinamide kinase/adenosylcobinamide-phosphate guanylyltransferase